MNIWIDDVRTAPDDWLWCTTSEEAIIMLDMMRHLGKEIEVISFDHDLGGDDTTRRIAMWIIEHNYWPQEIRLHTANPVGYEYLQGTFNRYAPESVRLPWND